MKSMDAPGTLRAAIYVRTSTEDQGLSFETQEERCRKYCEFNGWVVVGIYRDESTGRDMKRGDYKRLMSDMGKWDVMVVYAQTRAHRNIRNFLDMLDNMQADGKQFASVQEKIDTTSAMGWMFTAMLAVWAEGESRIIGERVTGGMKTAKAKGIKLGKHSKWFRIIEQDGKRVFEPTLEAAKIFQAVRIRTIDRKGKSYRYIHGLERLRRETGINRFVARRVVDLYLRWLETKPWFVAEIRP